MLLTAEPSHQPHDGILDDADTILLSESVHLQSLQVRLFYKESVQLPREIPRLHTVANLSGLLHRWTSEALINQPWKCSRGRSAEGGWRSSHHRAAAWALEWFFFKGKPLRFTLKITFSFLIALTPSVSISIELSIRSCWHFNSLSEAGCRLLKPMACLNCESSDLPCHIVVLLQRNTNCTAFLRHLKSKALCHKELW